MSNPMSYTIVYEDENGVEHAALLSNQEAFDQEQEKLNARGCAIKGTSMKARRLKAG